MLVARLKWASYIFKESAAFFVRGNRATTMRFREKGWRDAAAFSFASGFARRGVMTADRIGIRGFLLLCDPCTSSGSVVAPCPPSRFAPRSSLTDAQKAYIFQRSPYHDYRARRYGAPPPENRDMHLQRGEAHEEKTGTAGPAEGTAVHNLSPEETAVSELEETDAECQGAVDAIDKNSGSTSVVRLRELESTVKLDTTSDYRIEEEFSGTETETSRDEHSVPKVSAETDDIGQENLKKAAPSDFGPSVSSHEELLEAFYGIKGDPLEQDGGRIVVHRGNPKARLMIIGEAPGQQEDLEGKPFVGKAGQLLDKIFQYGGFDMENQVYVTNIAKRRPANNRTPTLEEVEYYLPYLREEIRLIDPAIIVLAGRVASQALLGPEIRITKIRGQWFTHGPDGPPMMPIFHPAYLLRKPTAKHEMVTDIEEIRAKYMMLVPEEELKPLIKVS